MVKQCGNACGRPTAPGSPLNELCGECFNDALEAIDCKCSKCVFHRKADATAKVFFWT